jgi:Uma2 family endonuclease
LTLILGDDCDPQPDVALRLLKGKTKLVIRGKKRTEYFAGPPELVVEAASSSESIDLHAKRRDYEKYGVGEYVAFLVRTRSVVWLVRDGKKFVDLKPGAIAKQVSARPGNFSQAIRATATRGFMRRSENARCPRPSSHTPCLQHAFFPRP